MYNENSQKTSLLERLKVCWYVLTMHNYIYFGISRNPFITDETGLHCNRKKLKSYYYVDNDCELVCDDGNRSFYDFVWEVVEDFTKVARGIKTDNKNK